MLYSFLVCLEHHYGNVEKFLTKLHRILTTSKYIWECIFSSKKIYQKKLEIWVHPYAFRASSAPGCTTWNVYVQSRVERAGGRLSVPKAWAKGGSQAWGAFKDFSPWVMDAATSLGAVRTWWPFESSWWPGEPTDMEPPCRWSSSLHDTTCQRAKQNQEVSEPAASHSWMQPLHSSLTLRVSLYGWGIASFAPRRWSLPFWAALVRRTALHGSWSSTTSLYQS